MQPIRYMYYRLLNHERGTRLFNKEAAWPSGRTHDRAVPGSSPALFVLGPEFKSSATLLK